MRHLSGILAATGLCAAALCGAAAHAATTLYTQTLGTTPAAVVNTDPNFTFPGNCASAEGCFGKAGQVDNAMSAGNLPATFMFNFTLTPGEQASVANNPGTGTLIVVAARDLGHKAADPATDWLNTSIDGNALPSLFVNAIDNCPAGERGTAYAQTLVCGINYHTDVTATEALSIPQSVFQSAAADGTITIALSPTASVGRVKIFSVQLAYVGASQVPTLAPQWLLLLSVLLAIVAWKIGRRAKA